MKKLDRKKKKNILGMGNNCPTGEFEASYNGYIVCCMKNNLQDLIFVTQISVCIVIFHTICVRSIPIRTKKALLLM